MRWLAAVTWAVDAVGVDLEQDRDAVPGAARVLGRGRTGHNRSPRPRPWSFPPPSVGWSVPVRGPVRLRPWTARTPKPGTPGRIADGGSRKRAAKRRKRRSAGVTRAERAGC